MLVEPEKKSNQEYKKLEGIDLKIILEAIEIVRGFEMEVCLENINLAFET